jgi:hypothetical protein
VFAGHESATLTLSCAALPAPDEPQTGAGPALTGVEPRELGVDGGQLVVQGMHLSGVQAISLGPVWGTVDEAEAHRVVATIPSLAGYEGQTLSVAVNDGASASGETDILVTVTG